MIVGLAHVRGSFLMSVILYQKACIACERQTVDALIPRRFAIDSLVGSAVIDACFGIDPDGMGIALLGIADRMPHFGKRSNQCRMDLCSFELDFIGEPLLM